MTIAKSSGANNTVDSTPNTCRGRDSTARLSCTRLARPGTTSISTKALRSSRTMPQRSTARAAPSRTNAESVATRWLPSFAT